MVKALLLKYPPAVSCVWCLRISRFKH